jgi:hypothetical protein
VDNPQIEQRCPDDGPALLLRSISRYSRSRADFPHPADSERLDNPLSEAEQALLPYLNLGGDKAGGWPDWIQDPNDPGANTRLLLQLTDGGIAGVHFGDGANLYVFQNPERPKDLKLTLQCY